MPTPTETRLAAYLAAEAAILQSQEVSRDGLRHRMAELVDVLRLIELLQRQVRRAQLARAGGGAGGLRFSVADLSGGRD